MGWEYIFYRMLQGAVKGLLIALVWLVLIALWRKSFYGYWWYGYMHPKGGEPEKTALPPRKDDY